MEEGVEMIEKILRKMKEGGTIDELAAELDCPRDDRIYDT